MTLNEIIHLFGLPNPIQITHLTGGANNRVYKLEFLEQKPFVLKQYFQHPNDLRPRLLSEFSFLQYAWQIGLRNIPKPLASSSELNSALYSFIPGKPVQIEDISDELIQEKLTFFQELNRHKHQGMHLPRASEACFSLDDYLQITEKRLERLRGVKELSSFFVEDLFPTWDRIKCKAALHYPYFQPIEIQDSCITPSDFGFHNTLIDATKTLFFIDFEYAGWDDPCQTVCDLICQPRVPIPERYFPLVSRLIASTAKDPESCLRRIQLILPVIQIRWCCILLNAFTNVGQNRRAFSHSDEIAHKESQLMKAKQLLLKIEESSWLI